MSSPCLELKGKAYTLVDRITRHPHLGAYVAGLMTCVVAPIPSHTYEGVRKSLVEGQSDLIKEIADDLKFELPR